MNASFYLLNKTYLNHTKGELTLAFDYLFIT